MPKSFTRGHAALRCPPHGDSENHTHIGGPMRLLASLTVGSLLVACATPGPAHSPPRPTPQECAALAGYSYSAVLPRQTLISSAVVNPPTATLPGHCQVQGTIDGERPGFGPTPGDSTTATLNQVYAIRWMLRLPTNWNGRFYFAGGGG